MRCERRAGIAAIVVFVLAGIWVGGVDLAAQQIDMSQVRSNDELRRGVAAFYSGYFNESILAFQKAIQYKADNSRAHFWLGRAYYYAGFDDAALGEWKFLASHGAGSPYLDNLINTITWRRGLGAETSSGTRYVISGQVQNKIDNTTLFSRPASVVPRADGGYFVTSFATQTVDVFNVNGARTEVLRGGLEGFDGPYDVVQAPDGNIFVSEFYGDRIALCDPRGNKIKTFGGPSAAAGSLLGPEYMAMDDKGFLYVSSWGSGTVSKFDSTGNFILSFGQPQSGYAGLKEPTGVAIMQGRVYVADAGTNEIDVFDESGNYIDTIATALKSPPEDISVYSPGVLLVADTTQILLVNADQDTVATLSDLEGRGTKITSAAVGANGSVIACDFNSSTLYILSNITDLYTALFVQIERVDASEFPTVTAEVTVQNRDGVPIVGLDASNFRVTEGGLPVASDPKLVFAGFRQTRPNVMLLADRSGAMQNYLSQMRDAAGGLYDALGGSGLQVITSGKSPVVETSSGASRQAVVQAAAGNGTYGPAWQFDLGVRLAGSELMKLRGKRAIVFVTQGKLGQDAFKNYGIEELAQYLKNNEVSFSVVLVDQDKPSAELEYLARSTGGKIYYLYSPPGVAKVVSDIRARKDGTYILQFQSNSQSNFGRDYIPLEVSLYVMRRTGRAEAGYYGPQQF